MSTSAETAKRTFPDKRPLYYYITDRKELERTGEDLPSTLRRVIRQGVDFVQIREKDLADRDLFDLACLAVRLAQNSGCRVLVNGRADIALAAGAHGAHLPGAGAHVRDIRNWLPPHFLVGASVHSTAEAIRARRAGSDYLLLGHVFPTKSKAGYGPPLGLDVLRQVCRRAGIPVIALGGILAENIASVLDAGADGIAGITLFQRTIDFRVRPAGKSIVR